MACSHMHLESKQIEFVTMIIKHTLTGALAERETVAKTSLLRAVAEVLPIMAKEQLAYQIWPWLFPEAEGM